MAIFNSYVTNYQSVYYGKMIFDIHWVMWMVYPLVN